MAKYIKIFFFLLLLGFTALTTACIEEIKESKNNGDIVIENNENYTNIYTYGVTDGNSKTAPTGEGYVKLIENCENNGNITVNNNTYKSSSSETQTITPTINVYGINETNKEIKNSTNNKNIEINNNSDNYVIFPYGIVKESKNIENCKNNGKIIVNGTELQEQ